LPVSCASIFLARWTPRPAAFTIFIGLSVVDLKVSDDTLTIA
jgi:hypothetical protein